MWIHPTYLAWRARRKNSTRATAKCENEDLDMGAGLALTESTLDLLERDGVLAAGTGIAGKAGFASKRLDARAGANGFVKAPAMFFESKNWGGDEDGSALNTTGCRVAVM
jgi:hypothetical protein